MAQVFNLPRVGDAAVEAVIQEWRVEIGEEIQKDQIVCDVETNKAVIELPCPYAGHVLHLGGAVGDTIEVDDLLIVVGEKGESWSPGEGVAAPAAEPKAEAAEEEAPAAEAKPAAAAGGKRKAMPAVRKLARELGVDLSTVAGTGRRGDITAEDVKAAAAGGAEAAAAPAAAPVAAPAAPAAGVAHYAVAPEQIEGLNAAETHRLTGMRGAVATSMMQSVQGTAQITHFGDWNAEACIALRQEFLAREKELGIRVSYTAILAHILAKALRKHPYMNSSIVGDEIKIWNEINIGVAVAAGDQAFLYVPVIRNADQKGVVEIGREIKELSEKAREGKIGPADLTGSTITLSSLSTTGATWGTVILNPPNAALMNTQIIRDAPVVRDGELAVGKLMSFSLTYDHRIINGIGAEWFLMTMRKYVENPLSMME